MNQQISFCVIGSNSFSGSHFVSELLGAGYRVIGISRSEELRPCFLPYKSLPHLDRFTFYQMDLNKDLDKIEAILDSNQTEYVVNFSSQSMVAESWLHPEQWFLTNTVSTIQLHDRLRKKKYLKKYVHISTPEVYGSCSGVVQENTIYNPSTPYATSRAACDMSLMNFYNNYGFPVVFTRAANVFGPGQQLYRIVPRAILSALTHKKMPLHGGGKSVRSFIDIRDVVKGTLAVALEGAPGEIFHFSTGEFQSIREVVESVAKMGGIPLSDLIENVDERPGKDAAYLLSSEKAKRELGWRPVYTFEQGLAETYEWAKRNLDELKLLPWNYEHKS